MKTSDARIFWRWTGRALPWLGLLVVSSVAAYELEIALTSSQTSGTVAQTISTSTDKIGGSAASDVQMKLVTITLLDPTTGKQTLIQCTTSSDRISKPNIVVDVSYARDVESALCER